MGFDPDEWQKPGFNNRLMNYAAAEAALHKVFRDSKYTVSLEFFYAVRDELRKTVSVWHKDKWPEND